MNLLQRARTVLPRIYVTKDAPKPGANAINNAFRVRIMDAIEGESWLGVLAQEVFECRFKWRRGLLPFAFSRRMKQELELMGHAVEIAVAVEFDGKAVDVYELGEAASMVKGYAQFNGWNTLAMVRALRERRQDAADWVNDHYDEILEWRQRYGH